VGASFFDATVDGSNFEDADMTMVNLEMAQLSRANLKNAVLREMYVGGKDIYIFDLVCEVIIMNACPHVITDPCPPMMILYTM